jgi:hypothetical protein
MQAVKMLADGVHDGLGGVHNKGDVVALPDDVVQVFLARNLAIPADASDVAGAILRAKQAESDRLADLFKSEAVSRMRVFDAMPPEVRAAARELGEDPITDHLNQLAREAATPPKRPRGRPRKERPSDDE